MHVICAVHRRLSKQQDDRCAGQGADFHVDGDADDVEVLRPGTESVPERLDRAAMM